jgi:hypothetical protein
MNGQLVIIEEYGSKSDFGELDSSTATDARDDILLYG